MPKISPGHTAGYLFSYKTLALKILNNKKLTISRVMSNRDYAWTDSPITVLPTINQLIGYGVGVWIYRYFTPNSTFYFIERYDRLPFFT